MCCNGTAVTEGIAQERRVWEGKGWDSIGTAVTESRGMQRNGGARTGQDRTGSNGE